MRFRKLANALMLGAVSAAALGASPAVYAEDVTVKLWVRADRSGPLRSGNIIKAADLLNKQFKAAGVDRTVKVDSGEFTIWDLSKLAKEVVDGGAAQYGIIHRRNVGPDFLMTMASFGFDPMDDATGQLQASKKSLTEFLK